VDIPPPEKQTVQTSPTHPSHMRIPIQLDAMEEILPNVLVIQEGTRNEFESELVRRIGKTHKLLGVMKLDDPGWLMNGEDSHGNYIAVDSSYEVIDITPVTTIGIWRVFALLIIIRNKKGFFFVFNQ
jgi:hypothetical protein